MADLDEQLAAAYASAPPLPEPKAGPVAIPEEEGDFLAGRLLYLDRHGVIVPIQAKQAPYAAMFGYTPASAEQARNYLEERAFHRRYSTAGQEAATFAEAAASALTFGASRWAERGLAELGVPGMSAEEQAARAHVSPTAKTLGTATGIIVPLALTAGAAGPAQAGAGALRTAASYTAPSLIARVGAGARSAVRAVVGEGATLAGRVATRAAQAGMGAGAETIAYALGHEVSESAIDPTWAPEAAAARVGISGLIGFGIGAGASGAWNLGKEVLGPLHMRERLYDIAEHVQGSAAARELGVTAKDARRLAILHRDPRKFLAEASDAGLLPTGASHETIEEVAKDRMRSLGPHFDDFSNQVAARPVPPTTPTAAGLVDRIREGISDGTRLFIPHIDDAQKAAFNDAIASYVNRFGAEQMTLRDMQIMRGELAGLAKAAKGAVNANKYNAAMWGANRMVSQHMDELVERTLGSAAQKAYRALNEQYNLAAEVAQIAHTANINDLARSMTGGLRGMLGGVGGGVVGGIAGATLAQGAGSVLTGGGVGGLGAFAATQAAKRFGPGLLAAGAGAAKRAIAGAAPGPAAALLGREAGLGVAAIGTQAAEKLTTKLLRKAAEGGALGAVADATGAIQQADRASGGNGAGLYDLAPIGDNPEKVALLAALERAAQDVQEQIETGAGNIVRGSVRGAQKARGETLPGVPTAFAKSADAALKLYQKRVAALQLYEVNPLSFFETLTAQTLGWHDHAPESAQTLNALTARGVRHLTDNIPKMPQHIGLLDNPVEPSRVEVSNFNLRWEAADKPLSILHQAAAGTLTPEAVATVEEMYPVLMQRIRQTVFQKIVEAPHPPPYRARLALSMLLKMPLDGSLSPNSIMATQARYALLNGQAQMAQAMAARKTKPFKSRAAKRAMTDTQAAAARGESEKEM